MLTANVLWSGVGVSVGRGWRVAVTEAVTLAVVVGLGVGVALAGGVDVGEGAELGTGANVIPGMTVGAWSVIGAGAAVIRSVAANTTVVGVPARQIEIRRAGWHYGK